MTTVPVIQSIHQLFETACIELFQTFGCNIKRILEPPYELGDVPIASIDAGSDDLEVMLILRVPMQVLSLTYPDQDDILQLDESKLEDWIPELANQLIGRLKNSLLKNGCTLKLGLPCTHFGSQMDDVLPDGFEHALFYFDVDNEIFECCLSLDIINDQLNIDPSAAVEDTSPGDGELELF